MYEILMNDKTLYHPNSDKYCISAAVLSENVADSGYMNIIVPCTNPLYGDLEERKCTITLLKDDNAIWKGIIRDINVDFNKNKSLYVVGWLGLLNDTVQPQRKLTGTKTQIFESLLTEHNTNSETFKHFSAGMITQDAQKQMEVVPEWEYTLDTIRKYLCSENEYVRVRTDNGVQKIDIVTLEDYGKRSEQYISFGDNLLDYAEESSTEDIASICYPLGAKLDNETIEGHDSYLTPRTSAYQYDYVSNADAISRIGKISKVVHFDEITDAATLKTAAENWLSEAQYSKMTLRLSAIDLSILESNVDDYALGDYVRAVCEPYGMDAWLPIREKQTDILNLANNKIVVGASMSKSMTTQQAEVIEDIQRYIPSKSSLLDAAKKNATALINGAGTDGHVVLHTNEQGVVYEILIMNTSDISTATKIWRWNENGFGYSNNGGQSYGLAMTMDGAIVADYITSGTMTANRIHGGTLTVGGADNVNGVINVKDSENNQVGTWNNEGIKLENNKGTDKIVSGSETIKFMPNSDPSASTGKEQGIVFDTNIVKKINNKDANFSMKSRIANTNFGWWSVSTKGEGSKTCCGLIIESLDGSGVKIGGNNTGQIVVRSKGDNDLYAGGHITLDAVDGIVTCYNNGKNYYAVNDKTIDIDGTTYRIVNGLICKW